MIRVVKTKAKRNNRRRPSLVLRKNEKRNEIRRINKFVPLSPRRYFLRPAGETHGPSISSQRHSHRVELRQTDGSVAIILIAEMEKTIMSRPRDIDYAAAAVKKAILEKFSDVELESLQVMAGERTIYVEHDGQNAEGRRDALLAAVRKAISYDDLWEVLANDDKIIR